MSKIDYNSLAVDGLKNVLLQVSRICNELDIDFFIVGAIARNIWFVSNDEAPAGTKDIDFGIFLSDDRDYTKLRMGLIEKYHYSVSSESSFCLITPDGKQIDLLPFGRFDTDNEILIEGKGLTKLHLEGFEEAFKMGSTNVFIGNECYRVCSVPAIIVLKLIAFDDRPEIRIKDINDIKKICKYYPEIESGLIWDEHFDLYDGRREHSEVAMIVLGREMRKVIADNESLLHRVLNILDKAIDQESRFLFHMIDDFQNENLEMMSNILENIKAGLKDKKQ